ncbi:MAG: polysaccharide deacetylase family protein [Lachnospiraceae bacterium]|jgi:peptidoglycan/xylan/chitin deacetylase (PgdA/CDA1 family)|nr:polysaccharide deacetylase family protein [Lachnospiraceae bacterium]
MFLVFNKEKIVSYMIALSTVVVLFFVASTFYEEPGESVQTASNPVKELPVYSVDTDEKEVSLSINCAWNADDIDLILETLNNHNTKITFFVVGDWAAKYPEALKKIYDAGHEIANHSDTHPHVTNLNYDENVEQIKKCEYKVTEITGEGTSLYRGPYGEYNDTVVKAAKDMEHIAIQWSIDTLDYQSLTGEQMWERINAKLTNGSIILMHNGTQNTALSLDMILTNIEQKGFKVVPVSELIYEENFNIDSNGVQHKNK